MVQCCEKYDYATVTPQFTLKTVTNFEFSRYFWILYLRAPKSDF